MSKNKIKNSMFAALFEGVKIYFSNMDKFVIYMLFPVFGQLVGIISALALPLGLADRIAEKSSSLSSAMLMIILLAVPGLLIFMKAFWDYMIAYVSLCSMTEGALTTGHVYDFQSHKEVATRRIGKYILLLLCVGLLSCVGLLFSIIPILGLIPPLIVWVYLILIFQVFTFEQDLSVKGYFKRSFELVKGNFAKTFIIMLILGFFSIFIITEGSTVIFDYLHLTDKVAGLFDFVGNKMPLDVINKALAYAGTQQVITVAYISKLIFTSCLGVVVAGLTLPIRSICWTLWYMALSESKAVKAEQKPKKSKKSKEEE
ncbi:hypothetical protein IJ596_07315 [bacterium]|nr:hypothetical protein [bacterium]